MTAIRRWMVRGRLAAVLTLMVVAGPGAAAEREPWELWLQGLRAEAAAEGVSPAVLSATLDGLQPLQRVVELDRSQPEFTRTFWDYLEARVTSQRIDRGKTRLAEHAALLTEVEQTYGVPARYLVAFWGLETNFGGYLGKHSTVAALATLAHDPRRSGFFRRQLLDALQIIQAGHVAAPQLRGSWAGAFGNLQFMPSTFRQYARDGDGDGRIDHWDSLADVFHSAGAYLQQMGWQRGELWGREVRLPAGFDWALAGLDRPQPLADWVALGLTKADGRPLPPATAEAALLLPQGAAGPAFLVYDNFRVIMRWNRSTSYALAVGHLADRLVDLPPIRLGHEADRRALHRDQVREMQRRLNTLGFAVGKVDGIAGAGTREGIRAFQLAQGLPADGHPSVSLLEALRTAADEG